MWQDLKLVCFEQFQEVLKFWIHNMSAEECRNHYSNDRNEIFFSCLFAFRAKSWPWQISGLSVIVENNKSLLLWSVSYYKIYNISGPFCDFERDTLIEVTLSSVKNPIFVIFYRSLREKTLPVWRRTSLNVGTFSSITLWWSSIVAGVAVFVVAIAAL